MHTCGGAAGGISPLACDDQLHAVVMASFLGDDSLIPEGVVRGWADDEEIALGARGRLPRHTWLGYAASVLAQLVKAPDEDA
jgi:hypothetical protein